MRTTTPDDVGGVRTLLAHGFVDDPMFAWYFPDAATRLEAVAAWLTAHAERYVTGFGERSGARVVEHDGALVGAALWRWPGDDLAAPDVLPTPGGLLTALVGPEHVARIVEGFAAERAVRPTEPHVYLHYLAVDAAHRGHGHGRALVDDGVARARAAGLPVLVETTNPVNVPIYTRLGFGVAHEVRLGEGPVVWILTAPA